MNEQSLFIAALEKQKPEERELLLEQACAGNPELRHRVDKLLERHSLADSLLDEPPVSPAPTDSYHTVAEQPGTVIGAYKLLQRIGEGGFGVVYMAEQEKPVRRKVALKIIKPGMDTAEVIARFESERQALAIMDHPNIAKVLEAGATASGHPYFVMELVKGVPITEFCDRNHLDTEARLKLFVDVCHAMQHAHHKGIIHRDVKPSNVMVTLHDGVPVVKVIDFGVAKATNQKLTERTLFTAFGQMVGTPAYMSPEQAEMSGLDIDTRTDVYSLGVLLYELLTGTTPVESKRLRQAGYAEMQRLIREEEPPRPSTRLSSLGNSATVLAGNRGLDVRRLVQLLSGDLDWVVMKALEKDRNRRYDTPAGFAEDIQRYLQREAILARPPSPGYKIRKFCQRNRSAVLMTAVVAAAMLLGVAIATWQAVRATSAETRAVADRDAKERARAAEAQQRERAESNERKAVAAQAETDQARQAAEKAAAHSQERLVRMHVANGMRLVEQGDAMTGLKSLVEALRLDQGNPGREAVHRLRIGAVLRQCPKLVQVWTSEQPVIHAEVSLDGQRVLIASDRSFSVHSTKSGQALFGPIVHDQPLSVARFSPDGTRLVSATRGSNAKDGYAQIWDGLSGTPLGDRLRHPMGLSDVAFHPSGHSVATSCEDNVIRLWQEDERQVLRESSARSLDRKDSASGVLKSRFVAVRFTPDGERVLVTFYDGPQNYVGMGFWNPVPNTLEPSLLYYDSGEQEVHTDVSPDGKYFWAQRAVRKVATGLAMHEEIPLGRNPLVEFSPDSRRIITGDRESGEAQVWDCQRGAKVGRPLQHRGPISAVDFSPDAGQVLTGSDDGTVRIWDTRTGQPASQLLVHAGSITRAEFSSNGHEVLTVSTDGTIRLWELAVDEPKAHRLFVAASAHSTGPSPSGRYYFCDDISIGSLWDPAEALRRLPYFVFDGANETWAFNEQETLLATGSTEKSATIWDTQTGRPKFASLPHSKPVHQVTFIGGSSRLLTVAEYKSATYWYQEFYDERGALLPPYRGADLRIWNVSDGQPLTPVMSTPLLVFSTDVSANGELLAAAGGDESGQRGGLYLWDAKTGRMLWSKDLTRPAQYVEFSPDGRFLVTAANDEYDQFRDDAATIWEIATGDKKWEFQHEARVTAIGFHPAAPQLVTGSGDRTVRRWSLETGEQLGDPLLHSEAVQDAAFVSGGRLIASATVAGDVRLWDPVTGEAVTPWLQRNYEDYSDYSFEGDATTSWALNSLDREWDVQPVLHALSDLTAMEELLGGITGSNNHVESHWNAHAFRATWQRLKTAHPEDFQVQPSAILNWHQRQALWYTRRYTGDRHVKDLSRWFAAAWHADRLLPLLGNSPRGWLILRAAMKEALGDHDAVLADYTAALDAAPRDEVLLRMRGRLYLQREDFELAKQDFLRELAIISGDYREAESKGEAFTYAGANVLNTQNLQELVYLCLQQRDATSYRQACEQMIELSRRDGNSDFLEAIAWLCVLTPAGIVDSTRIVDMATEAAKEKVDHPAALRTLGAALFRAGEFEKAKEELQKAIAAQSEFPSAWLFLAMTENSRGRPQDAKKWLDQAVQWIEREHREKNKAWGERVYLDRLLQEAMGMPEGSTLPGESD